LVNIVAALRQRFDHPPDAAIGGQPDFSQITFTINNSKFMIGDFVTALIGFLIISAVVYFFVVLPVNRLMNRFSQQSSFPTPRANAPFCTSKISKSANTLSVCTSEVQAVA